MSKNPFEDDFLSDTFDLSRDDLSSDTLEPEDFHPADFEGIGENISLGSFSSEIRPANSLYDKTKSRIISTETLEEYLFSRHKREEPYGIFSKDITMCRYFESKDGENWLSEIEQ